MSVTFDHLLEPVFHWLEDQAVEEVCISTPAPPQTRCGAAVSESDITSQLHALIDLIVHAARDGSTFMVDKVWFRRCAT
jgi:hypothetical protein